MCRYAFKQLQYKTHYVCFDCRKTFKQPLPEDMAIQNGDGHIFFNAASNLDLYKKDLYRKANPKIVQYLEKRYFNKSHKCPDCGQEMFDIGKDFKAPKKQKIKEWEIVRGLYKMGKQFHTCGCNGFGYIPKNERNYKQYLLDVKTTYQVNLKTRATDCSVIELKEYLEYWTGKIQKVDTELLKFNI